MAQAKNILRVRVPREGSELKKSEQARQTEWDPLDWLDVLDKDFVEDGVMDVEKMKPFFDLIEEKCKWCIDVANRKNQCILFYDLPWN